MSTSRPTILQIIPRLDTGGAERATVEITAALVAAGARALVATEGGRMAEHIVSAGGELVHMPVSTKNPVTIYRNAARLTGLIRTQSISLCHARSRAPAWSTLIATRRTGIPFVTTYHGAYSEKNAMKRAYNGVMARADIVIANSRYTADLIRQRYATPDHRIAIIPRGLDPDVYSPGNVAPARVSALRTSWQVPTTHRIVLHAARLSSWKGQHIVIEAARQLLERQGLGDATIVLAGDNQGRTAYDAALRDQIEAAGLTGLVKIVGHVDDIAAAFLASHVSIIASLEPEAFGRAATEAQAMQCPVIATRLGAPQETVHATPEYALNATTGWLVAPGEPAAMASALAEALALPALERQAMGERARAHVTSTYTLDRMKNDTLAVYDQLLGTDLCHQLKS